MTGTDLFFYVFNLEENLKKINILKKEVKVAILYDNSIEYVILFLF